MMTHLTLHFDNLVSPLSSSVSPHSLRMSQDLDHHSSQHPSPDQSVVVPVVSLVSHMTRQRESRDTGGWTQLTFVANFDLLIAFFNPLSVIT